VYGDNKVDIAKRGFDHARPTQRAVWHQGAICEVSARSAVALTP